MGQAARTSLPYAALQGERVKAFLRVHPETVRDDPDMIERLGLRIDSANLVDFGPAALERASAASRKETIARKRLEAAAEANQAVQRAIQAAALDLLDARDLSDLARCVDDIAVGRFGLTAGVVALESETGVPLHWSRLAPGQLDMLLPPGQPERLGHLPTAQGLFGAKAPFVASAALIRMALWRDQRPAVLAFGSPDADGFADGHGADLLSFLARITERAASALR
jgi:uncharacterized protein YigA (DUF484 family)